MARGVGTYTVDATPWDGTVREYNRPIGGLSIWSKYLIVWDESVRTPGTKLTSLDVIEWRGEGYGYDTRGTRESLCQLNAPERAS